MLNHKKHENELARRYLLYMEKFHNCKTVIHLVNEDINLKKIEANSFSNSEGIKKY